MNPNKLPIFLILATLLLGGCSGFEKAPGTYAEAASPERVTSGLLPTLAPLSTMSPLPTLTPLSTMSPLPTLTPEPTPTPQPTATPEPTPTPKPTPTPRPTPTPTRVPLGNETIQSKDPGSLTFQYPEPAPLNTDPATYTFLVNKDYPISSSYIPYMVEPKVEIYHKGINERRYLQPIAATALEELFAAAEEDGLHLVLRCGFRSYKLQKAIYSWNLKTSGYHEVTRYHALAGTSEHQTGLAVDLCCKATGYQNNYDILKTAEYAWLLENAHLYGWILRYPEEKTEITGYNFEPWHFRYVGVELATYLKEMDLVLEEYYGVLPRSNLFAVPEEYWSFLSEEDLALMQKDIEEYEKKQKEQEQEQPEPTPNPDEPLGDETDPTPDPDEPLGDETDPTPDPDEPLGDETDPTPDPDGALDDETDTSDTDGTDAPAPDEASNPDGTDTSDTDGALDDETDTTDTPDTDKSPDDETDAPDSDKSPDDETDAPDTDGALDDGTDAPAPEN